ncbi:MAG: hypothetical protein KGV57_02175 [Fusobacterium sp.]|nr:hypothetical protein [Fusobacterium sp.]
MKHLFYIGTNKYSLSTEDDIMKMFSSEFNANSKILKGTRDILRDLQNGYRQVFKDNADKYYCKVNESKKLSLATGILIKILDKNYKKFDDKQIIKLFTNQLEILKEIVPEYFIVNAALYFYENNLTLRVVGIPHIENKISKSKIFTRGKIEELRLKLYFKAKADYLTYFFKKIDIENFYFERKRKIEIFQLTLFKEFQDRRIL